MCGIGGVFNAKNAKDVVNKQVDLLKSRGRDGHGIQGDHENFICHTLHAVVNRVNQPFQGKGQLTTNCEIYNWKELDTFNSRNDAELLFNLLENEKIEDVLPKLDGVYALAYWKGNKLFLARDIIGEKPLFYYYDTELHFASEKKVLLACLPKDKHYMVEELNPRIILEYNIDSKELKKRKRPFFELGEELTESEEEIIQTLIIKIKNAIKKRIPKSKFGILFSGGIDSTLIAYICKQMGLDFVCYTAALEGGNFSVSSDLEFSREIAEKYNLNLKIATLSLEEVKQKLKILCPLIESNTVVKVGVGLTMFAACEEAQKDGVKVIFSGIGSEELFAGYERHRMTSYVNKECLSGLLKIYERDAYRDDVITMFHGQELRSPFLDLDLIEYSLKIPTKYKLDENESKLILRKASSKLGLDHKFAFRKKVAAQYGSKFDKALSKLSGDISKAEYLKQYYEIPNQKLAVLFSGGKDSTFAAYTMYKMNYELSCLISIKSLNPDSYMFHTPNIDLTVNQAEKMNIPLIQFETKGEKEIELEDLKKALLLAKEKYNVDGVVTGALFSSYQRDRIDKICDELGLKNFCPLWHMDQELLMRSLIKNNFKFIISSIAADGLDKSWLGKEISNKEIDKLIKINKKNGLNIAFEGGEAESLVLDCPLFNNELIIKDAEIIMENNYCGKYVINELE